MPVGITVLGGFLGAGKTTLINHLLQNQPQRRLALLVNDFGEINIDSQLVSTDHSSTESAGPVINLANGCICCTLGPDLITQVLELAQMTPPPDHMLVETSGVSEPAAILHMLSHPTLQPWLRVDGLLVLVDAANLLQLAGHYAALARAQIRAADMVLLNKIDLIGANELIALKAWIHAAAPAVRIVETSYGQIDPTLLFGLQASARIPDPQTQETRSPPGHNHAHTFATWRYGTDQILRYEALYDALAQVPATILRAKGIVHLYEAPARRGIVQMVGSRIDITLGAAWGAETPRTDLVLIGAPAALEESELRQRFAACQAGQPSPEHPSVEATLAWVRCLWLDAMTTSSG